MKGHARLGGLRILGAPVYVHWSVPAVSVLLLGASNQDWLIGIIAVLSYLSIIVLHEAGHAFFARRVGTRPTRIAIGFIHGSCQYDEPYYERDDLVIAWGGVVAQAAIGVPLVVANALFGFGNRDPFGPVIAYLGFASLLIAAFNLLPLPGLDGEKAWKLVPMFWSEFKERRAAGRGRTRKKFKVVK